VQFKNPEMFASLVNPSTVMLRATLFGDEGSIAENKMWTIKGLQAGITPAQLSVAIGSVPAGICDPTKVCYGWSEARLRSFVEWVSLTGVQKIDLWDAGLRDRKENVLSAPYYFSIFKWFLGGEGERSPEPLTAAALPWLLRMPKGKKAGPGSFVV
jgi:hypothetical protein